LAVGSQAAFDWWDLDSTCPSTWILDPDLSVRVADGGRVDLDQVEGWL